WPHQKEANSGFRIKGWNSGLWCLVFGLWTLLVPPAIFIKRFKQFLGVGMVNRHRRHLLRRRNSYLRLLQPRVRHIFPQRIKNHRANVPGSWLQEVAEDIEIVFYVAQSAGGWDKSE